MINVLDLIKYAKINESFSHLKSFALIHLHTIFMNPVKCLIGLLSTLVCKVSYEMVNFS